MTLSISKVSSISTGDLCWKSLPTSLSPIRLDEVDGWIGSEVRESSGSTTALRGSYWTSTSSALSSASYLSSARTPATGCPT